jgi:hypothetical protein
MSKTASELLVRVLEQTKMKRADSGNRAQTEPAMSGSPRCRFMDYLDCAAVALGRHRRCHLSRLDTGRRHRCASLGLCRDGVRGDYFTGRRVRSYTNGPRL